MQRDCVPLKLHSGPSGCVWVAEASKATTWASDDPPRELKESPGCRLQAEQQVHDSERAAEHYRPAQRRYEAPRVRHRWPPPPQQPASHHAHLVSHATWFK